MSRYQRVCATIFRQGPSRERAKKVIGVTICATRKIRWREVQALFFIHPARGISDYEGDRLVDGCKDICGSLIDLHREPDEPESEATLYVVHETATRYDQICLSDSPTELMRFIQVSN